MIGISRFVTAATLAITLALGVGAAACDSQPQQAEYVEVCIDSQDNRVSEDMCRNSFNSDAAITFLWMYFLMSYALPPHGGHINRLHGTAIRPANATFYRAPAGGGTGYKPATQPKVNTPPKQPARPAPPPVVRRK